MQWRLGNWHMPQLQECWLRELRVSQGMATFISMLSSRWLITLVYQVNSHQVNSTPTSMAGSWTYAHCGLTNGSPMVRNSLGQYSSMNVPASYPGSALAAAPYPGSTAIHPVHTLSSATFPYGPSRQSYPTAYSHSYADDLFQNYALQQPSHYHPTAQEAHLPSLDYLSPEVSRQWTPVAVDGRQPQHNLDIDQESSSRLSASVSAGTPNAVFPGLGALKNYLPSFAPHRSRTLPMPESQRTSISHSTNSVSSISGESAPSGFPQALSYRSGNPWNADKPALETTEVCNGSISSTGTGSTSINSSSSPQVSQKSTTFGFQALPSNPSTRESYYVSANISTSTPSADGTLDPEHATFHGRLSKDTGVTTQQPTSSHYGYSFGSSSRIGATSDQMVPDGTLMSGQLYTRLEEPHQSYENLPALSGGASSHAPYRTSISSLTNNSLY